MARSNIDRLEDALRRGDIEAAMEITEKLKEPRKKPKPKSDEDDPKPSNKKPIKERQINQPKDDEDWIAPSITKPRTKVGEDGTIRTEGRWEDYRSDGFKNKFRDNGRGGNFSDGAEKLDKAAAKAPPIERRPGVRKVETKCDGCGKTFYIYPSEFTVVYDQNERPVSIFKCERCIGKR